MLDIIVKTIDGQNRSYSVPDNHTVRQFKEKISSSMNIPVERQRLIFQGRELKDTSLLSEFDVNGKTLHLVQRVPPTTAAPTATVTDTSNTPNSSGININQAANLNQDVQQIIQQLIGGLGEFGQNATFNTTTTGDMNGMEVHIDLGNVSQLVNENEIRSRIRNIRRFLTMAQSRLNRIEEIQSGAPLNDAPHSTIIVGSIQTTTINDTFDPSAASLAANQHNQIHQQLHQQHHQQHHLAHLGPHHTTTQRIVTTSIPFSTILSTTGNTSSSNNNSNNNNNNNSTETATTNTNATLPQNTTTTERSTNLPNNPPINPNETSQQQQQQQESQNISVQVLADLTQSVMDSYSRFQPYLQQYHDMLRNDANESSEESPSGTPSAETSSSSTTNPNILVLGDNRRQRFFNNINDMMHLLGHLFHNLSDLHVNIRDRPPRQIHTMSSMQHSTSAIISSIPLEASIQIPIALSNMAGVPQTTTTTSTSTGSSSQQPAQPTFIRTPFQARARLPMPRSAHLFSNSNPNLNNINTQSSQQQPTPLIPHPNMPSTTVTPTITNQRIFRSPVNPLSNQLTRIIRPNMPSPINYSTLNSYDQFLPCNSVHFYNSSNPIIQQHPHLPNPFSSLIPNLVPPHTQRRRHPAGDQHQQQQQQQQSNENNNTNTNTQQPGLQQQQQQNVDMQQMLNNLLSNTIRNTLNSSTDTSPATNTPTSTPNVNLSPGGRDSNTNPIFASIFGNFGGVNSTNPIFGQLLSGFIGQTSSTSQSQSSTNNTGGLNAIFSLLNPESQTDGQLNQPLSELMSLFGDADEFPSTSTLNIFNIFFQSLRIGDLVDLVRGQNRHVIFERTHQPLRDFLRNTHQINNSQTDRTNLENFINKLYLDMFILENTGGLNLDLNNLFPMNDNSIDFSKSFEKLVKAHLRKFFEHILETNYVGQSPEDTWSLAFFIKLNTFLDQLVTLMRVCIGGSPSRLASNADEQIIQFCIRKIREIVDDNSMNISSFFGLFESYVQSKIQQLLLNINLEKSSIEEFIIHKTNEVAESNLAVDDDQYDSASSTLSGHSIDMDQHFSNHEKNIPKTSVQQPTSSSSILNNENIASNNKTGSSSNLDDVFPITWLPIIERDMQKLSENANSVAATNNYSDAYLNGMPSKKRKLLFSKNDLLTKNLFKRVLSRTLEKIQIKSSNIYQEQIINDSLNHSRLIDSFDAEFDSAITDRLRNDPDFNEITQQQQLKPTNQTENENESKKNEDTSSAYYSDDRFQNSRKRLN